MSLPGSGDIDFNTVRTEMSQSLIPSYFSGYALDYWTSGNYSFDGQPVHSPINLLSSGSRFSENNPLYFSNLSMSAWYDYNHSAYVGLNTTTSLYPHFAGFEGGTTYASSMTVIDLGTSNATYNINISGSSSGNGGSGWWVMYYGKPWSNDGTYDTLLFTGFVPYNSVTATPVASGSLASSYNNVITYNYTYNSSKGQYLYAVIYVENYAA